MNRLVEAALLKYSVSEALGIAIDADEEATGYDLRWVRGTPVATSDLARIGEAIFGRTMETSVANPFGEARHCTPPEKPLVLEPRLSLQFNSSSAKVGPPSLQ